MKLFLTLAVYSVRIQSTFPSQATITPLIAVYFTITIVLVFLAYIYFVVKDYLDNRDDLPEWLLKTGVFFIEKLNQKETKEGIEMSEKTGLKCNKCALCDDGEAEKQKQKEKKDRKDQNTKILRGLNWVVFIMFLFVYVLSFVITWGLILAP